MPTCLKRLARAHGWACVLEAEHPGECTIASDTSARPEAGEDLEANIQAIWESLTSGQRSASKTRAREAMVNIVRRLRSNRDISIDFLRELEADHLKQNRRCPSTYNGKRCVYDEHHKTKHWNGTGKVP